MSRRYVRLCSNEIIFTHDIKSHALARCASTNAKVKKAFWHSSNCFNIVQVLKSGLTRPNFTRTWECTLDPVDGVLLRYSCLKTHHLVCIRNSKKPLRFSFLLNKTAYSLLGLLTLVLANLSFFSPTVSHVIVRIPKSVYLKHQFQTLTLLLIISLHLRYLDASLAYNVKCAVRT